MDDSVYVKVIAANVYGDSVYSDVGNGAVIWIVPEAPINLQNDATAIRIQDPVHLGGGTGKRRHSSDRLHCDV